MFLREAVSASPTATTDVIAQAADSFDEWQKSIFELGMINTLIYAAIVAVVTLVIIKIVQHTLGKKLEGNSKIFYRLIYVAIIVIAVLCVLVTIKPVKNLGTVLLASSGIAGIVIGLASQETLGNIFSGISISTSKPFVVGEYIEILNVSPPILGIVQDIGLRHTTIRDASNKNIVIPNSVIDKDMIRTTHHLEEINVTNFLDVGISYNSDIDLAIQIITNLVKDHKDCLDVRSEEEKKNGVPVVTVRITDLGEFAVHLRAFVWTKDTGTGFSVLSDLRYAVKKAFAQNGIEIPYPYQNVIIKRDGGAAGTPHII